MHHRRRRAALEFFKLYRRRRAAELLQLSVMLVEEQANIVIAKVTNSAASDYELAQAAARGEMRAFEGLYERHYRRVYSLCLRMVANVTEAEDLTQEVFIHLFRKLGSFRGESAFTTWLHRLTVNHVLMHFRKRGVRLEKTTEEGKVPESARSGNQGRPPVPVIDRIALDKAIAQLPPGYRMAFVLHDIEGYEHEEVANLLGCSVGTSKSQLHKARMRLRELLTKKT